MTPALQQASDIHFIFLGIFCYKSWDLSNARNNISHFLVFSLIFSSSISRQLLLKCNHSNGAFRMYGSKQGNKSRMWLNSNGIPTKYFQERLEQRIKIIHGGKGGQQSYFSILGFKPAVSSLFFPVTIININWNRSAYKNYKWLWLSNYKKARLVRLCRTVEKISGRKKEKWQLCEGIWKMGYTHPHV